MGERRLTPQATLFGKVIMYECTACKKHFPMSLLEGAVAPDAPVPLIAQRAFQAHDCADGQSGTRGR